MAILNTRVQHRRGTSQALNSEKNNSIEYLRGEIILENIGTDAANWHGSESTTKYLLRVGNGGSFKTASCVWAHAVDVPSWLKVGTKPNIIGDGDITTGLNSLNSDIEILKSYVGDKKVSTQITDAINLLDYTYTGSGDIVTSVTQNDGKIEITKSNITVEMLSDVGYATLKSTVGDTATGLVYKVNNLESSLGTSSDTENKDGVTAWSRILNLAIRMTSAEGSITTNGAAIKTLQDNLGTINTESSTTAFGKILALEKAIGSAEGTEDSIISRVGALETAVGTDEIASSIKGRITTAENNISANTEDIEDHEDRISGLETTVGDKDSGLVKELADLKKDIGNISNIMNFVGAVSSLPEESTEYHSGDVIVITSGADAGKEFVYDDSRDAGSKWVEFGNSDATSTAISNLRNELDTAKDDIDAIETAIGSDSVTDSIKGRIKIAETDIDTIETAIGSDSVTDSIKGRIKIAEDNISNNANDIDDLSSALGVENSADKTTAFGKIKSLEGIIGDSSSGLIQSITKNTDDINTIIATIGDANQESTTDSDLYSKIRKNTAGIKDNLDSIIIIQNALNKGFFTIDDANKMVFYAGLSATTPTEVVIDCGEVLA